MAAKIFKAFRYIRNSVGTIDYDFLILAANTSKEAENILREYKWITPETSTFLETDEAATNNEQHPVVLANSRRTAETLTQADYVRWVRTFTTNVYDCGEKVSGPVYREIK